MESLSLAQAQKMVLLSQKLPPKKLPPKKQRNGGALANTLSALENLGYVQIDTISVIQRAHHHTLWNRNQDYQLNHLDKLLERREVFEYWSHAAAYLPRSRISIKIRPPKSRRRFTQPHNSTVCPARDLFRLPQ